MASQFGPEFNAFSFAYGVNPNVAALQVISAPSATGTGSITLAFGYIETSDGINFRPLATNAPFLIGNGSSLETVTPTAVSSSTPTSFGTTIATGTFAQLHGIGDQVRSGSAGLQECINYVAGYGGGVVLLDARWAQFGGTTAMIQAAILPSNVSIQDSRFGGAAIAGNVPGSNTALAAPTALTTATATNGMITTATTGGSIPASSTYRLGVTYVDIFGGETTLSIDTASTATIASGATATNTITVTSPAALAGAVGYRVYMTAASGASLSEILYPVGNTAITGTAATASGLPAFAIGTPVTITAIITGTATVPSVNTAYSSATAMAATQNSITSYPPFGVLASVAAAGTGVLGEVNLPAGFLNQLGRTLRIKGMYYATTNSTPGTLTTKLIVASVPGVTSITPFSVISGTTTASAVVSAVFEILVVVAAIGATGTLEVHGTVAYNLAGTAVSSPTQDIIIAVSSTVNLTVQDQLQIALTPTTTATTNTQLRQLTIEVLQ